MKSLDDGRRQAMTDNVYSPLVQSVETAFNSYRDLGYEKMLVFLGAGDITTCEGVLPGQDAWAFADQCRIERPDQDSTLLMALDLDESFAGQFPAHLSGMEHWDAFSRAPLIQIPDRNGTLPVTASHLFERAASGLPPTCVTFNPEIPAAPAKHPPHLSLVIS
jgi:hypothetical protein